MSNPDMVKSFVAGGTIANSRIVKPDSTEGQVVQGAAATDLVMGVVDTPGGVTSGQRVDVVLSGIAFVEFGGTVAAGEPVTANASGQGVKAAPAAGVNNRIIGFAYEAAVSGDIRRVVVSQGSIQG